MEKIKDNKTMEGVEKRTGKVIFAKAGNGTGAKVALSVPLLKEIGITVEEREIEITYNKKKKIVEIKKQK